MRQGVFLEAAQLSIITSRLTKEDRMQTRTELFMIKITASFIASCLQFLGCWYVTNIRTASVMFIYSFCFFLAWDFFVFPSFARWRLHKRMKKNLSFPLAKPTDTI